MHDGSDHNLDFDVLQWPDEHTLCWALRPDGHAPEYLYVMFPEVLAQIGEKTGVGLVMDLRGSEPPNAEARRAIRAQMEALKPRVRGIALVLDESPGSSFTWLIAQVLASHVTGITIRMHKSVEAARAWLDTVPLDR